MCVTINQSWRRLFTALNWQARTDCNPFLVLYRNDGGDRLWSSWVRDACLLCTVRTCMHINSMLEGSQLRFPGTIGGCDLPWKRVWICGEFGAVRGVFSRWCGVVWCGVLRSTGGGRGGGGKKKNDHNGLLACWGGDDSQSSRSTILAGLTVRRSAHSRALERRGASVFIDYGTPAKYLERPRVGRRGRVPASRV